MNQEPRRDQPGIQIESPDDSPPPLPDSPPKAPPTAPTAGIPAQSNGPGGLDDYHAIADTIGMVPSLRLKDNLIQLIVVLSFTTLAFAISWFLVPPIGVVFITALAFIVSGVISGFVLMIMGWVRAAKRKKAREG